MTCRVADCPRERGLESTLCQLHRSRWQRHRSFNDPRPTREQRFWAKVDKRGPTECWPWLAQLSADGYGRFKDDDGPTNAHRYSYKINIGPIPDGYEVDHVRARGCTLRSCVNPAHLEAVTQLVNWERAASPARLNALKTHCKRGHPFDEANTFVWTKTGARHCRACALARYHARRARLLHAAGLLDDQEANS